MGLTTYYPLSWLRISNIQSASALPFLRRKTVNPLLVKTYQPNLTSQEFQRKRERLPRSLRRKKMARKNNGRCPRHTPDTQKMTAFKPDCLCLWRLTRTWHITLRRLKPPKPAYTVYPIGVRLMGFGGFPYK